MHIKYDYHSLYEQIKILFILLPLLSIFVFIILLVDGYTTSGDLLLFSLILVLGIGLCVYLYLEFGRGYVEVTDEGIYYNGWRKKIFSSWIAVRKIRTAGRAYKISTDNGSFYIRRVEYALDLHQDALESMSKDRAEILKELIEEIKTRAPHAEFTYSVLDKPL